MSNFLSIPPDPPASPGSPSRRAAAWTRAGSTPQRLGLPDAAALVKLKLNTMAVLPGLWAYLFAGGAPSGLVTLTLGLAASAFGASALNQCSEWRIDRLMRRTADRPVPSGKLSPTTARLTGLLLSGAGLAVLAIYFPPAAAGLALATILLYWLVYTPMKRRSPRCTEIGAVADALPALVGGVAGGAWWPAGGLLFLVVFLWQMPHFHPIAWLHREDYAKGGFRMLSVVDPTGRRAARAAVIYAILLLPAMILTGAILDGGWIVPLTSALLGLVFLRQAVRFRDARDRTARGLFRGSLVTLCLFLLLLLPAAITSG